MSVNHMSSGKILLLNLLSNIDDKLSTLEKSFDKTTVLLINTKKTVNETKKIADDLEKNLKDKEKEKEKVEKQQNKASNKTKTRKL